MIYVKNLILKLFKCLIKRPYYETVGDMEEVLKYWETDARFYKVFLCQDLFGDWTVERKWGSKYSRRAGGKSDYCLSYEDGLDKLRNICKIRERHRYLTVQTF